MSWVNVTLSAVHSMYVDVLDETYWWLNWPRPKSVVVGRREDFYNLYVQKLSTDSSHDGYTALHVRGNLKSDFKAQYGHNSVSGRMQQ